MGKQCTPDQTANIGAQKMQAELQSRPWSEQSDLDPDQSSPPSDTGLFYGNHWMNSYMKKIYSNNWTEKTETVLTTML